MAKAARSATDSDAPPVAGNGADAVRPIKKRRLYRRDQILDIAIKLFAERGYHATAIHDIGAAAGLTGPAVYRHFASKEEILEAAVQERASVLFVDVERIVESTSEPEDVLRQLADVLVTGVLDDIALATVFVSERRALGERARQLAERVVRLYVEEWVHALAAARPEVSDAEARLMVHAALQLAMSVTRYQSGLEPEVIHRVITQMILDSLLR
jgi:AcrR family transcriptional regulator